MIRYSLVTWWPNGKPATRDSFTSFYEASDACAVYMARGANMTQVRNEDTGVIAHSRFAAPIDSRSRVEAAERDWAKGEGQ